jgi:hypothetical protein
MSTGVRSPTRAHIEKGTLRQDNWWINPLLVFLGFTAFVVYSTWRAFAGSNFYSAPYLSPFYSPCLSTNCGAVPGSAGAPHLGWFGNWWIVTPAVLILIFPLGFRLTCYYYRKAYYRSFWLSPPACAVGEPHRRYSGETRFPLIFQNIHRYALYAALIINVILFYDAALAFRDKTGAWGHMGLGTLILLVNAVLLLLYSVSCHSCRHIVGGRLNNFSRHPLRYRAWTLVSRLNARHMQFAWASLFTVAFADFYVLLVASGTITDLRFF